jgi:hypothetical protein
MIPEITPEMREALARQPGAPVEVRDDRTSKIYLLVDRESGRALTEQWLREQLDIGLTAADRGDVVRLNVAEIKDAGRLRRAGSG